MYRKVTWMTLEQPVQQTVREFLHLATLRIEGEVHHPAGRAAGKRNGIRSKSHALPEASKWCDRTIVL